MRHMKEIKSKAGVNAEGDDDTTGVTIERIHIKISAFKDSSKLSFKYSRPSVAQTLTDGSFSTTFSNLFLSPFEKNPVATDLG